MKEIISKCGMRCDLCPVFSKNIDKYNKQYISDTWFKYYGFRILPDNLNCDGCLSNGILLRKDCYVRECNIKNNTVNCAYCDKLFCDKLQQDIDYFENALINKTDIPKKEYKITFKPFKNKEYLINLKNKIKNNN